MARVSGIWGNLEALYYYERNLWRRVVDKQIRGHCLCGQVVYTYTGSAGPAGYCHCEDCRRCTGSAFNVSVRMKAALFAIQSGEVKGFTKRGSSGNELTRHFCAQCGSPIYTSSPRHPEYIYVKAGTLDDPDIVAPEHQSWVTSAVPWHRIASDIQTFSRSRPSSPSDITR